jgi:hypothetical protein
MNDCITITVAGMISDPKFHRSRAIAMALYEAHSEEIACPIIMEFFETQWEQFLKKTANTYKGVFYEHKASPLVYLAKNNEYIGDGEDFSMWALHNFNQKDNSKFTEYQKCANDALCNKINDQKDTRQYAQLTFKIGKEQSEFGCIEEAVIIELFKDICPKTV